MAHKIIDLSVAIEPGLPSDPEFMIPQVDYLDHDAGAASMLEFFPGLRREQLPGGKGWAVEMVRLTTHSGTHLDAPWHYHPTQDKGDAALTIDQIPLEWCLAPGVVLDFSHKADGEAISSDEVAAALEKAGHRLQPLDIVLIRTGADQHWGTARYLTAGAGMTRESTLWLLERGVRVVGTDAWSWDRPLPALAQEFAATGDASVVWEAHFAGMEIGYCHLEKLANLAAIGRATGFTVACFPIKVARASAGWARAVAILDD